MRLSPFPSNHKPGPSRNPRSFLEDCSRDHIYLAGPEPDAMHGVPGGAYICSPLLWKESMASLHPWVSPSQWTSTRLPVLLDAAKAWGLFSPLWENEVGRCEGSLLASGRMAITPFTTPSSSDDPAPPARRQQPAPSLVRLVSLESPSWQMACIQAQSVLVNQHV